MGPIRMGPAPLVLRDFSENLHILLDPVAPIFRVATSAEVDVILDRWYFHSRDSAGVSVSDRSGRPAATRGLFAATSSREQKGMYAFIL